MLWDYSYAGAIFVCSAGVAVHHALQNGSGSCTTLYRLRDKVITKHE